uniref:Uncharacterized protein n=1 Tax=Arundo donax TaxID=35708 RepID=A0A0A8ZJX7_ARUDO
MHAIFIPRRATKLQQLYRRSEPPDTAFSFAFAFVLSFLLPLFAGEVLLLRRPFGALRCYKMGRPFQQPLAGESRTVMDGVGPLPRVLGLLASSTRAGNGGGEAEHGGGDAAGRGR